jgi:ABC-type Fe3+-hydroxamate transport system substrate-binding protein
MNSVLKESQFLLNQSALSFPDRRTLIAVSAMPFVVAGKNTFMSEIIEGLGLVNMASDVKVPWPVWPLENLLADPPALLVLADGEENQQKYQSIFKSLGLNRSKIRIIVPQHSLFLSPSPAIITDIQYLAKLLLNS